MDEISLIELFREDAEGQLDLLQEGIVAAERDGAAGDALTICMRAAHSLKGAARVIGLDEVVRLAHAMEEGFQAARDGRIRLSPADCDRLLAAVDLVRRASRVAEADLDTWLAVEAAAIDDLVMTLTAIGQGPPTGAPADQAVPAPASEPSIPASTPIPVREPTSASEADRPAEPAPSADSAAPAESQPAPASVEASVAPLPPAAASGAATDQGRAVGAIKVTPEAIGRLMALSAEVAVELRQLERHVETLSGIGRSLAALTASLRPAPGAPPPPGFAQLDTISRQLGKEVRLVVRGTETAVDRDILATLDGPLGHLVRNALDHALEAPADREAAGKDVEGRLVISAAHRGGALVIHVEDDGRGIDAEKVRARAVAKGLVDAAMASTLTSDEVLEFLFLPGFSTAGQVTDVSGRGVGLDVVQAMVHASGGSVRVATVPGEGTTFSLHLPVTRSVLRCLLIVIGGEPFGLPLSHVDRLVRVHVDALVTVEGRACVRVDDETVGIVPAVQVVAMPEVEHDPSTVHVVVLSDRGHRHGLEVEGFLGERDLVVRPLDPRLGTVPDVLAASLLEDGTPIVILDPDDLVRSIDEDLGGGRLRRHARPVAPAAPVARRILVVDDSLTVREVERQLLEAAGYRVETAVDGAAGWNALRLGDIDLLVTDVDMPRMTGIELTRRVRSDTRLARLPVIIVSYKDREEDRLAGMDAGADRYLTKSSFTDDSLITAVADLLTRTRGVR